MRSRQGVLIGSVLISLTLVAAACSDVSSSSAASSGSSNVPDNSTTTIKIAISPWLGSAANVAVAQKLLEDQLGYTVETKELDEYTQFKALSSGDQDATLEVWPSGHAEDYAKYIDDNNGVVDGGLIGITGQIGWYIPTYMLQDHPELATWEGIKGNESLFKTSDSGDAGQILDGDPSYVTYDQPIADNLGLNLEVKYAGSEAAELTELDTAYSAQDPILMYFWTPHWAQAKYELTSIQLPAVSQACTDAIANSKPEAYACAYPADPLYKAFSDKLAAKAPAAFAFLSAMQWTVDDQNSVSLDLYNGADPATAAQNWIDAHPDVWQPWVDAGMAAQG